MTSESQNITQNPAGAPGNPGFSAGKEFAKYTSLNVLGMVGLSCYILADTFFISKGLGANGLAALNLAIPVYSFIHGCGLMLGMGGGTKYSICQALHNSRISGFSKDSLPQNSTKRDTGAFCRILRNNGRAADSSENLHPDETAAGSSENLRPDETAADSSENLCPDEAADASRSPNASENADRVFTNMLYAAAALAVCFVLAGIFFSGRLTRLLGADAEIAGMTQTYLRVILLFSPAFIMNNLCICFVRNDGAPRLSMLAMLGGSFSNIILDYILIFPLHMGILGAVLATGIAPLISMLILSGHLLGGKRGFHTLREKPRLSVILPCISLGFPSLVTEVSSGIVIIIFNIIFLKLAGNVGIAAYGVIANLSLVVVAVYNGIAQGIQPVISRAYGRKEEQTVRQVFRYGVGTVLVLSVLVYAVMFLFADPITGIFNSEGNARLKELAQSGIRLYFTVAPFVGFNILVSAYFTSVERAVPAQAVSVIRGFVLIIPMAFVMAAAAGVTGVWLAFPVTEGVVSVMGLGMYWKMRFLI